MIFSFYQQILGWYNLYVNVEVSTFCQDSSFFMHHFQDTCTKLRLRLKVNGQAYLRSVIRSLETRHTIRLPELLVTVLANIAQYHTISHNNTQYLGFIILLYFQHVTQGIFHWEMHAKKLRV